jgi:hypothetical protein
VRLLELAAVIAFLGGCGAIGRALWRRLGSGSGDDGLDWRPYHSYEGGSRKVYVRRGSTLEPVGEVPTSDPDYEDTFLRLMDRARERAATLNSER